MSAMQRSNGGQADERKAVALVREPSGWDVRRRVRQHDSDRPWADYTWTVEGSIAAWAAARVRFKASNASAEHRPRLRSCFHERL